MAAVGIALIGVFGALVGVIATEAARKRPDEAAGAAQPRAAARMVNAEMGMAAIALDSAKTSGPWGLAALPTTGWAEHGAQLAAALTDDEFHTVADAATKVGTIKGLTEVSHKDRAVAAAQMADTSGGEAPLEARRVLPERAMRPHRVRVSRQPRRR